MGTVKKANVSFPASYAVTSRPRMKLSSVAHNDNAHDDGVWAVCWSVDPETGEGVLLTGSVDEGVRTWRSTDDGLEMTHSYIGTS